LADDCAGTARGVAYIGVTVLVTRASFAWVHTSVYAGELGFEDARGALMSASNRLEASESEVTKRELARTVVIFISDTSSDS